MNVDTFKQRMQALPEHGRGAPIFDWDHHRYAIREAVTVFDASPETMLSWPTMQATMVVRNAEYTPAEYEVLMRSDAARWGRAIRSPRVCEEEVSPSHKGASETLIHQAYHLLRWEMVADKDVAAQRSIAEIGGGYGAMALVCRRAGFKGLYSIFDVPEILLCAEYYLDRVGVDKVMFSTEREQSIHYDLCIACWSVTELYLHERWMPKADSYLIAYHELCDDIDNVKWLDEWATSLGPSYHWFKEPTSQIGNYMIGWKR